MRQRKAIQGRAPAGKDSTEPVHESCDHHVSGKAGVNLSVLTVEDAQLMAEFFSALADPTRLRLLSVLSAQETCVWDLASQLDMTQSAISHQLRTLRAARIVRYRKQGRHVYYRLHDHHVLSLYETVREHLSEP